MFCEAVDHSEEPGITAMFPETLAGSVAVGTCASPLHGLPQRLCLENGTWSDSILRNPCAGTCAVAKLRTAGREADDCCKARAATPGFRVRSAEPCPALENDGFAQWTAGTPGVPKTGTCIPGYAGNPQRLCDTNGWQPISQGACERTYEGCVGSAVATVP